MWKGQLRVFVVAIKHDLDIGAVVISDLGLDGPVGWPGTDNTGRLFISAP